MPPDDARARVSATALGAALMRAQESGQPDALFEDPYAAAFVAAAPRPFADIPDPDGALARLEADFRVDVALRTRFFDDFVTAASANGIRQVVILAAGLDTRAFRLGWPAQTRLFELDRPDVIAFKDAVLTREHARPHCRRLVVPVDLREDWPAELVASGFDGAEATAWAAEGLLVYLPPEAVARLFDAVSRLSAARSELAFDVASAREHLPSMSRVTSLWHDATATDAIGWLEAHDWNTEAHDRDALARRYGRAPRPTMASFVTATRSDDGHQTKPI